jgi:hypothetical protein
MDTPTVISFGLDYVRFRVFSTCDCNYIAKIFPYLDITKTWFHGLPFVDLTGSMLATIRMMDDLDGRLKQLSRYFPVKRIDVYIDVYGNLLPDLAKPGTVIENNGNIETIYSIHLKRRGNVPAFCRAYDAKAAEHYAFPSTRFECEFKREYGSGLLVDGEWVRDPIAIALGILNQVYGCSLSVQELEPLEWKPPRLKPQPSRKRFYKRYGKNILLDMEEMGLKRLYEFVQECLAERSKDDANQRGDHPVPYDSGCRQ